MKIWFRFTVSLGFSILSQTITLLFFLRRCTFYITVHFFNISTKKYLQLEIWSISTIGRFFKMDLWWTLLLDTISETKEILICFPALKYNNYNIITLLIWILKNLICIWICITLFSLAFLHANVDSRVWYSYQRLSHVRSS